MYVLCLVQGINIKQKDLSTYPVAEYCYYNTSYFDIKALECLKSNVKSVDDNNF